MAEQPTRLSDQVRAAIRDSGLSRYAICKAAGIDQAAMSRFMAGKTNLTLTSVDALAVVLGLEIVQRGPLPEIPKGKPGRPRKVR